MFHFNLSDIPATPGVYIFKDASGVIIYVGKAKQLRRRLASYTRSAMQLPVKTAAMLTQASSLQTIVTSTEKEALLLESSLIKEHRPRYNIVLRDDKDYMLFYIDKTHAYPRIEVVRPRGKKVYFESTRTLGEGSMLKNSSKQAYYGPFSSALAARETLKVIQKMFPLRRCSNRSFINRVRPCLYYHMGQCLAPCTMNVKREEYQQVLHRAELFLGGKSSELLKNLQREMQISAENLDFEHAATLRDQIEAIKQTIEKQWVVLRGAGNLDVVATVEIKDEFVEGMALGVIFVRDNRVMGSKTFFWPDMALEDAPEIIFSFLLQFYDLPSLVPPRILLPFSLNSEEGETGDTLAEEILSEQRGAPVNIILPSSSLEKNLLNMAGINARQGAPKDRGEDVLERLGKALHLPFAPKRIEVVDVSHTQGEASRISMVVFENGQKIPEEGRVYKVKLEGMSAGDDYAALGHFAMRRAKAGPPWPDLLLVDGGKGQIASVAKGFESAGIENAFGIAGIAKARTEHGTPDRRAGNTADRIFLPGRSNPLNLKSASAELLFLQRLRDFAHEAAIKGHRRAFRKTLITSELTNLPGVGPKTAQLLWEHFASLAEMAAASEDDLAKLPGIGKAKAKNLVNKLKKFV